MKTLATLSICGLLLAGACGQPAQTPTTTLPASPEAPGSPALGEVAVEIVDFGFAPDASQVQTGGQIVWTNTGNVAHTVTFEGAVDSGSIAPGGTFEHTFETAGSFEYICTIHPTMRGTVTVGP